MPHEEVRDYFYARQNYVDVLDVQAEALAEELGRMQRGVNAKNPQHSRFTTKSR